MDPVTAPYRSAHGKQAGDYVYPHSSWGAVMKSHVEKYADKIWMVYLTGYNGEVSYTYAEFVDRARKLATLLLNNGVGEHDRVAIAGHNHPDTILSYFACWLIGACAVPLNMTEDDDRLTYIIENSGAKLVLCRSDYMQRMHERVFGADHPTGHRVGYRQRRLHVLPATGPPVSALLSPT